MIGRIHYTKPSISDLEVAYATDAARNGWGERCYEYIHRLEALAADKLGVKHTVATSSGTGAMHMGLSALGVGVGHEVILADINWIATAAPVTYLGARPVLVDIDPHSWCIDPERVARAITPRTKAIIATHLYGNVCNLGRLSEIARTHGIPVIEDAAEAIGSQWQGRPCGSIGKFGIFSFHGTKTLTMGEGGLFVTNDSNLYETVLTLSNHGRARGQVRQFWPDLIGFKYKMSNIQAALGCGQFERLDELVARKRRVFAAYVRNLRDLPVRMNPEPVGTVNGYWMPTIVVDETVDFDRDELLAACKDASIDARVFFWPLSSIPAMQAKALAHPAPIARNIHLRAVNLPSYHDLSDDDIGRVCLVVRNVLMRNRSRRAS